MLIVFVTTRHGAISRSMRQTDYRASIRAAAACTAGMDRDEPIARAVMADLKEHRIIMPPRCGGITSPARIVASS